MNEPKRVHRMKRVPLYLLTILILVLTLSTVQAAEPDYSALKAAYIQNHPGTGNHSVSLGTDDLNPRSSF